MTINQRTTRRRTPRPDEEGYDLTMRQVTWLAVGAAALIIFLIYSMLKDDEISVQNTKAMLASVPAECREEARAAMMNTLSTRHDVEIDDLRESISPVVENCAIIGALTSQVRE